MACVGTVFRDDATAPFFEAAARGEFLLRRSTTTGRALEPMVEVCPDTGSRELEWVVAAGDATVVTWTVVYRRPRGGGQPPHTVIAVGELTEGPWWWAPVVGAAPKDLHQGRALRIDFERPETGEAVPVFRLA